MKFRNFEKYEVYEDGRIWSYSHKKFLKPKTNKYGYQEVCLVNNEGKKKYYKLHRVVYESFTGSPIQKGLQVNHIDECKTNNHINNLNLMTCKENINWGCGISRRAKSKSKQVGAYKDGELVMVFPSTAEAGRQGFRHSAVSKCCNNCFNRLGNNVYKGYEWRYL